MLKFLFFCALFVSYYLYLQCPSELASNIVTIKDKVCKITEEKGIQTHFHSLECLERRRKEYMKQRLFNRK